MDDKLADMPGDTVLYDDTTTISQFSLYANNSSTNKLNNFFGIQTDSIHIPDSHAIPQGRQLEYVNLGTTGFYDYIEPNPPPEQIFSHYKAGFTIIN